MIDPFVILTPLLVLAVVALVGFVGCFTKPAPPAPLLMSATPGDQTVTLSWEADTFGLFDGFTIKRGFSHGGPYAAVADAPETAISFVDTGLANGTELFYVITGKVSGGGGGIFGDPSESGNSNEVSATPNAVSLITVTFDNPPPPGNPLNDLNGTYKNLGFGTGAWIWLDPATGGGPGNAIAINAGPNPGAGDITFVNGSRILVRIRVFPKRATTITISDNTAQNPQVTAVFQTADANAVHFIDTGWTLPTSGFDIGTDIGFDLLIDTIIYQAPA
jgi:hypothetical protein